MRSLGSVSPLLYYLQGDQLDLDSDDDTQSTHEDHLHYDHDPHHDLYQDHHHLHHDPHHDLYQDPHHHHEHENEDDYGNEKLEEIWDWKQFRKRCAEKLTIALPDRPKVSVDSEVCTVCLFSDELVVLPCGHKFCEDCIRGYLLAVGCGGMYDDAPATLKHDRVVFKNDGYALVMNKSVLLGIRCLERNCPYVIGPELIKKYVDEENFKKFDGKLLRMAIYDMGYVTPCPIGCGNFIQSEDCLCSNEECKIKMLKLIRMQKLKLKHQELKERQKLVAWSAVNGARCCPNCFLIIVKNGGCNHMHCHRCGTHFNWSESKLHPDHIRESDLVYGDVH